MSESQSVSQGQAGLAAYRCAYKDLCIDVSDLAVAEAFWSVALGLTVDPQRAGHLVGATPEQTVWLNVVAEPTRVKNRVHLDLHTGAVDDLVALGCEILDTTHPWTIMADPEGAELCAFFRRPDALPGYRLYELGVDSADPERIARWWGERLGVEAQGEDDETWWWVEGASLPWGIVFAPVPEAKTTKNRVHLDVWGDVDGLVAAGATLLRRRDEDIDWDVLADPEGNEFCVFTPA